MKRTLTLKSEHLSELTSAELSGVVGGATQLCPSEMLANCRTFDWIISFCGCLTNYCSIDVC